MARVRAPGRRGLGWHCRPRSSLPLDKPGLAHLQELTRPKPRCRLLSEGNKTGNRRLSDRHLRGCPGWRAASREAAVSSEQHLLRPVCPVAPSVLEAPQESPNKSPRIHPGCLDFQVHPLKVQEIIFLNNLQMFLFFSIVTASIYYRPS